MDALCENQGVSGYAIGSPPAGTFDRIDRFLCRTCREASWLQRKTPARAIDNRLAGRGSLTFDRSARAARKTRTRRTFSGNVSKTRRLLWPRQAPRRRRRASPHVPQKTANRRLLYTAARSRSFSCTGSFFPRRRSRYRNPATTRHAAAVPAGEPLPAKSAPNWLTARAAP